MAASLPDDLIPDILVLIPPEEPACLVLASAVCKAWRRIVTDPAFSGRYRALHRTPPMLGFFHNPMDIPMEDKAPSFVPTTSFRLPTPDRRMRHMFDCHHGRVLLYNYDFESPTQGFNVWDPLTDDQHIIPDVPDMFTKGAVVCTAASGGCHHRSCSAGPFIVAFAGVNGHGDAVHADFYSSETREWSLELYIYVGDGFELKEDRPAVLVGDSLYFVGTSGFLVRYCYSPLLRLGYPNMLKAGIRSTDLVTMIEPPKAKHLGQVIVMTGEDGGLGLASLYGNKISLWLRETGTDGAAGWVQHRTIDLKMLLPLFNPKRRACLSGVIPERANIIFVSTEDGVFRIEFASLQARKVSKVGTDVKTIYPFVSFYTETLLQRLANSKLPEPVVESVIVNESPDNMAYQKESVNPSSRRANVFGWQIHHLALLVFFVAFAALGKVK